MICCDADGGVADGGMPNDGAVNDAAAADGGSSDRRSSDGGTVSTGCGAGSDSSQDVEHSGAVPEGFDLSIIDAMSIDTLLDGDVLNVALEMVGEIPLVLPEGADSMSYGGVFGLDPSGMTTARDPELTLNIGVDGSPMIAKLWYYNEATRSYAHDIISASREPNRIVFHVPWTRLASFGPFYFVRMGGSIVGSGWMVWDSLSATWHCNP